MDTTWANLELEALHKYGLEYKVRSQNKLKPKENSHIF